MQYTVRAIMVATALTALLLVIPSSVTSFICLVVWLFTPGLLATLAFYGHANQRAFAIGGLATYIAMSVNSTGSLGWSRNVIHFFIVACAGGGSVALKNWLERNASKP